MSLNIEALHKTSLFHRLSDYFLFMFVLLIVLTFSLLRSYENYLSFKHFTWHSVDATVIAQRSYIKEGKQLTTYSLKSGDMHFKTRSDKAFKSLEGRKVRIAIYTEKIAFIEYLKGFYAYTQFEAMYHNRSLRMKLIDKISNSHEEPMISNLYGALFFAQNIKKGLRDKLSHLGINHLAAISGFHLGLISFLILLLSNIVYKPLHQRYFPYRNRVRDMMIVLVFAYVAFLEFTPSLLRAYSMMFIGFILYDRGIKLLSVSSLLVTVTLLLALFPALLFSMGFWLSVLGVLNLFIILKHFEELKKWQLFIVLHIGVFVLMMPWVIFFFGSFSIGQFLSPLLSMVFILFYPLSIGMHLLGLPDVLDMILMPLLSIEFENIMISLPMSVMIGFIFLLTASVFSKKSFYFVLGLMSLYLGFLLF